MSYHDNEALACDLTDKLHDLHAGHRIKSAGRLVGKKNFRLVNKGTCNSNTLTLTTRKLVRSLIILIREANLIKGRLGTSDTLILINTCNGESKLYVAEDGLVRNQVIALEDEADTVVTVYVPVTVTVGLRALAIDNKVARGISVKTADDVK